MTDLREQRSDLTVLRKRLAEFMGWKLDQAGCYWFEGEVVSVMPTPLWDKHAWHPDEDISQAFTVAEKIASESGVYMQIEMWKDCCRVRFRRDSTEPLFSLEPTPALAISLAADAWLRQWS